jgi:hypothetical protein
MSIRREEVRTWIFFVAVVDEAGFFVCGVVASRATEFGRIHI